MSYEKDVRATVALLGGSMSTLVGPAALPASQSVRKRTVTRAKTSESNGRKHRNSTLGILGNLFGRKEKTQSAIFHLDGSEDCQDSPGSIYSSTPSLNTCLSLPYPLHPLPLEGPSSTFQEPFVFAVELSWAEEVQYAVEMASPFYDDTDSFEEFPPSPEFASRQYSLMRRHGIRRKTAKTGGKRRRFTHSCYGSGLLYPELADKLFRGLSAPATSGTETTSDSDNPVNGEEDVVDVAPLVVPRIIPSPACLIHHNMSQYALPNYF